jgi:hypothetical protein
LLEVYRQINKVGQPVSKARIEVEPYSKMWTSRSEKQRANNRGGESAVGSGEFKDW